MKSLILSDDPRVAYNRAPERKRMIHQLDALPLLAQHLKSKFLFILFRVTSALPSPPPWNQTPPPPANRHDSSK
jgi:hypothetical protein